MRFNCRRICTNLLKDLPQRTAEIIQRRFGLDCGLFKDNGSNSGRTIRGETLEAIGKDYGITRERVRQIENEGFAKIQPKLKKYEYIFRYFDDVLKSFGDAKKETTLLAVLGNEASQNCIFFLLNLANGLERVSETQELYPFWTRSKAAVNVVQKVIKAVVKTFQEQKTPLNLAQLFVSQKPVLQKIAGKRLSKDVFSSYLEISKEVQSNPEGKFGLKDWLEINPRGVKDKSYLVLKQKNRPLHFTQITDFIRKSPFLSQRGSVHVATIHNELIKDPRFVLVGRGVYALREWGYEPGVVKDIIFHTLKGSSKPLSKEEILKEVLKQRLVKKNTVLLNLQDRKYFLKNAEGKYMINPAIREA